MYDFTYYSLPEPEPLRHNISNYIHTAKKVVTSAKEDVDKTEDTKESIENNNEDEAFIIRESEIGPEVTHIYQIENKVDFRI